MGDVRPPAGGASQDEAAGRSIAWPDDGPARGALSRLDLESYRAEILRLTRQVEPLASEVPGVAAIFLYDQLRTLADSTALDAGARESERRRHYWISLLGSQESSTALVQSFLAEVDRVLAPFRAAQRSVNPIVLRARRFIEDHAGEPVSLSRVATELRVARNYLSALFRRETGVTLTEYIHQVRIRRAELLLRAGDLTLAEAAYRVGYQSYRHFYRNFVRLCGLSPTTYVRHLGDAGRDASASIRRPLITALSDSSALGPSPRSD